jgi:hypothetical protein
MKTPTATAPHLLWALVVLGAAVACRRAPPAPSAQPAVAALAEVSGPVVVTRPDGSTLPAGETAVRAGDRLTTGPGGHATIRLADGAELVMGESAELALKGGPADPRAALTRGEIVLRRAPAATPAVATLVLETPYGLVRVPARGTEVHVALAPGRALVELTVGQATVARADGTERRLAPKESVELTVKSIEMIRGNGSREQAAPRTTEARAPAQLPARPPSFLVLPMNDLVEIYCDRVPPVTLGWPAGISAPHVQVARDQHFTRILLAGISQGPGLTMEPPGHGSLYWRLLDADGREIRRAKARFLREREQDGQARRRAANNVLTDTGVAARLFYQAGPPAVTLVYTPHPRARRYRVRVAAAQIGNDRRPPQRPAIDRLVAQTRLRLRPGTLTEGTYLWSATPVGEDGRDLEPARTHQLTIVDDHASPGLLISAPRAGARPHGKQVSVAGVAPPASKLFVNGQPAPLDGQGRFKLQVTRAQAVVFRLVDGDGRERFWVRGLGGRT